MKHLKRIFISFETIFFAFLMLFSVAAFSQAVVSPQDFLDQVMKFIQSWGGIPSIMKVAGIIMVIISSMKVTVLNQYIWSKLGAWQAWVAPILGLVAGILGLGMNGPITPASVFAYVTAGAGAIILHELLDTLKAVPGVGTMMKIVIDIVEQFLNGPSSNHPSAILLRKKRAEELSQMSYKLKAK